MAINNSKEIRYDKDDFTLTILIEDTTLLTGYKAEFKVYEYDEEENTIGAVKLTKTTDGHFDPDEGGITFDDNKVLVEFDTGDFDSGSLDHNYPYWGRLVLWDTEDKRVVAAVGQIQWNIHPDTTEDF